MILKRPSRQINKLRSGLLNNLKEAKYVSIEKTRRKSRDEGGMK